MLDRVYKIHLASVFLVSLLLLIAIPTKIYIMESSDAPADNLIVEEIELIQEIPEEKEFPSVELFSDKKIEESLEISEIPCDTDDSNLLSPSNVSIEELEYSLYYELKPLASAFLKAEEDYGVNACYLASIAALESGWGRYQFKENNLFGFGSKSFDTPEECIDYVAKFLATEYLSVDGRYYSGGYSLQDVNRYYNGSDEWYEGVSSVYAGIMNRVQEYRG